MRLTQPLNLPPRFHFWKDFGAGKKRRIPYYKQWWNIWRGEIFRKKVADHTLKLDQLPPGSRLMEAEDFMSGHIDALPAEIIKMKEEKVIYDHPWPFNIKMDPVKTQQPLYHYQIDTRFFAPRDDCLTLTKTLLENEELKAQPPLEPTDEHIDSVQRHFDWSTKGDSVLVKLPNVREYPKINLRPRAKYGATKERQEMNILTFMMDSAQNILAKHYAQQNDHVKLNELLRRRSVAFPYCQALLNRDGKKISLELCIDTMSVCQNQLPPIYGEPQLTKDRDLVDIRPRSWKSILERTNEYFADWTFKMPPKSYPHTIQLTSRIKRDFRSDDEMLARSIVHAFGLTSRFALFKELPIGALAQPLVLQTIGFELLNGKFHFMKYQLNTTDFSDQIKNQAWYSGPIDNVTDALRYYLDFQAV